MSLSNINYETYEPENFEQWQSESGIYPDSDDGLEEYLMELSEEDDL